MNIDGVRNESLNDAVILNNVPMLLLLPTSSEILGTFSFGTRSIYGGILFSTSSIACWVAFSSALSWSFRFIHSLFIGFELSDISSTSPIPAS